MSTKNIKLIKAVLNNPENNIANTMAGKKEKKRMNYRRNVALKQWVENIIPRKR